MGCRGPVGGGGPMRCGDHMRCDDHLAAFGHMWVRFGLSGRLPDEALHGTSWERLSGQLDGGASERGQGKCLRRPILTRNLAGTGITELGACRASVQAAPFEAGEPRFEVPSRPGQTRLLTSSLGLTASNVCDATSGQNGGYPSSGLGHIFRAPETNHQQHFPRAGPSQNMSRYVRAHTKGGAGARSPGPHLGCGPSGHGQGMSCAMLRTTRLRGCRPAGSASACLDCGLHAACDTRPVLVPMSLQLATGTTVCVDAQGVVAQDMPCCMGPVATKPPAGARLRLRTEAATVP